MWPRLKRFEPTEHRTFHDWSFLACLIVIQVPEYRHLTTRVPGCCPHVSIKPHTYEIMSGYFRWHNVYNPKIRWGCAKLIGMSLERQVFMHAKVPIPHTWDFPFLTQASAHFVFYTLTSKFETESYRGNQEGCLLIKKSKDLYNCEWLCLGRGDSKQIRWTWTNNVFWGPKKASDFVFLRSLSIEPPGNQASTWSTAANPRSRIDGAFPPERTG